MLFLRLIVFLLVILAPCAIAAWLGTLLRRPLIAFVLAWLLTPILTLVVEILLWPFLRALTPPDNDGTVAIMLPFFGIITGLVAGGGGCDRRGAAPQQGSSHFNGVRSKQCGGE
jgi:membrane associated rhomboid family serine protease